MNEFTESAAELQPRDEYNQELLRNVHPADYENPEPVEKYNLVVIGAGTAGLVTAAGAAGLGAKVALIERRFMGGDCLNYGCVPSKGMIRSARAVAEMRRAPEFGIHLSEKPEVNFSEVMERMRKIRSGISHHDSVERFSEKLGIDVFLGEAHFVDDSSVQVGSAILKFKKAVIATGARPLEPDIPGLKEADFLTNETLFSVAEQPERLAIIGAGPIGCEMAQTFQRLGTQVTLIDKSDRIFPREDPDALDILEETFRNEGIEIRAGATIENVSTSNGSKMLTISTGEDTETISVNEILVGIGRTPNIESLNLDIVGVEYDSDGVQVNDRLQTTNKKIFAAGDVCLPYKFTHSADAAARIVIQNTLFLGRSKLSDLVIPWTTYTEPEISHVGMYEHEAREAGIEVQTFRRDLKDVDRAKLDGQTDGFVKVITEQGKDKILGATIVADNAGDLISEITLAMVGDVGLSKLANVIHPYPTQAEAIKQVGDAYNRTRLTPFVQKLFKKWLAWTR